MDAGKPGDLVAEKEPASVERTSERELVVTRTIDGPVRIVFGAWTKPELFQRWWIPKSCGLILISYEPIFARVAHTAWR